MTIPSRRITSWHYPGEINVHWGCRDAANHMAILVHYMAIYRPQNNVILSLFDVIYNTISKYVKNTSCATVTTQQRAPTSHEPRAHMGAQPPDFFCHQIWIRCCMFPWVCTCRKAKSNPGPRYSSTVYPWVHVSTCTRELHILKY